MGQDSPPKLPWCAKFVQTAYEQAQPLWYIPKGLAVASADELAKFGKTNQTDTILKLAKDITIPARQKIKIEIKFRPFGPVIYSYKPSDWCDCDLCGKPTKCFCIGYKHRHMFCHCAWLLDNRKLRERSNRHDKRRVRFKNKSKTFLAKLNPSGGISYYLRTGSPFDFGVEKYGCHGRTNG